MLCAAGIFLSLLTSLYLLSNAGTAELYFYPMKLKRLKTGQEDLAEGSREQCILLREIISV